MADVVERLEDCAHRAISVSEYIELLADAAAEINALRARLQADAGGVREALEEAIEFAEQDIHALTPAGEAMVKRWRAALSSPATGEVVEALRDYPARIWVERDEETNEKRWFSIAGSGVEYVRAGVSPQLMALLADRICISVDEVLQELRS